MAKKKTYYGHQTKLALKHFDIGLEKWPQEVIVTQALVKKAAATANASVGVLGRAYSVAIQKAANEVISGKHNGQFPLSVWQSGSGTQFNMNMNEVLAARANEILTGKTNPRSPVHPNDHVNMSQSTNDTVPTALHIASAKLLTERLLPSLSSLEKSLVKKSKEFKSIKKIGRTHLQDAVTLSLGDEFSGYAAQVSFAYGLIKASLDDLCTIPIGGTAVGTGLNAPKGYRRKIIAELRKATKLPLVPAPNLFESIATHGRLVSTSGSLESLAVALMKIANDIRFLGSGPHAGLGELMLPANEPGSSIMPGKVNPTQCEALMMVAAQVMGNHTAMVTAEIALSNFELQTAKPLFANLLLQSIRLLADAIKSFEKYCVRGIRADTKRIAENAQRSLVEMTRLGKDIGYDKAARAVTRALQLERKRKRKR